MSEKPCSKCPMRKKFEDRPRSLFGRLWYWHTKICPGWNGYLKSLPEEERQSLTRHIQELRQS